jgi:hypothetical protein
MNWIKENKFLAGFIAILVVGAGALGYLLYSAWGAYSDVSDQYTAQSDALKQLQARVPYPDEANLSKYKAERDDMIDATHELAASLSKMVLPIVEMTPSAFQDHLRDTLSDVSSEAVNNNVKLPEHFSMDFEKYQTSPPPAEAAGPLGRQMAALKMVMDILIDEHVDSVVSVQRTPLPQENPGGAARAERGGRGGGESPGATAPGGLVENYPFEVQFTANQPAFQKVLNDLAASTKQFFITRTLLIANSDPRPVPKEASATPPPAPAQPFIAAPASGSGAANALDASGGGFLKFIVGTEKLDVAMRIDMVTFNPPEKSNRTGTGPAPGHPR